MNELHLLIFVNDSPFGCCNVLAHLEHRFIGHRNPALLKILDQIIDAVSDTLTFCFQGQLDEFRIGGSKIGGCHCIGNLTRHEAQAIFFLVVG